MTRKRESDALRAAVAEAGRTLLAKGLVAGTGGNISARVPGSDLVLVTPSGIPYPAITAEDVAVLSLESGRQVDGMRRPSVETPIHLRVLRDRLDVGAAIHTHSTYASAVASAHQEIPVYLDSMSALLGGPLRLAPYGPSGSETMQQAIAERLRSQDAVLLANHGAFVVGKDLEAALLMAELVEAWAKMYVISRSIGGPVVLPDAEVRREREWFRTSYGQPKTGERG